MRKIKGFTLVELLISSLIFSVIALSLYSVFQTGILSYDRMDSAFYIYQTARIILDKIEVDLKNAYIYSEVDSRFSGTRQNLEFLTVCDFFDKGVVYSDISKVKYDFNSPILKRIVYQNLDALKPSPESPLEIELSSKVREISFQYALATGNADRPFDWQDSWPRSGFVQQVKTLPLVVKIKLSLIQNNREQKKLATIEFTKIISLNL